MKKDKGIFLCLAVLFALGFLPLLVGAQEETVGIRMDVDNHQVAVGDKLYVTIEFKQLGNGNSSVVSGPSIPTPEHFEIGGQTTYTQMVMINQQSTMIYTTKLTLVATTPGNESLGPASLIYQDTAMKKKEIKSNTVNVTVVEKSGFSLFGGKKQNPPVGTPDNNPPANPDDLRGLKPLLPEIVNIFRYALWTVVGLLIIGFFLWQFLKPKRPSSAPAVQMGVEAQFRDAWKKLGNEDLSSKEFCFGLSRLVRECLQYRYQFPAVNYTTEEILREMSKRKSSDDEKAAIDKCLKTCDRVLHADGNLTGRDNLRAMASVILPKAPKNS